MRSQKYCTVVCRLQENGYRQYEKNPEGKNKQAVAWRKNNRAKSNKASRKWQYQEKYGIPLSQKEIRIAEQNHKCAACGTSEPGGRGDWCTDHNHETRQLRGELCHGCNTSLGLMREDPNALQGLITYIKKWDKK